MKKKLGLGHKTRVYQWIIGCRIGAVMYYKVTDRRYKSVEDVLSYEVTSTTSVIKKLKGSACTVYEKEYTSGLKKYGDPEYSRQIRHSGGLDGHFFNR